MTSPRVFLAWLVAALPCAANALSSGADFLRAEIPARPAAMSGAFGAFHDDANAMLWNPASLARVRQPLISATHFSSIVDTTFDQTAYAQPFKVMKTPGGLGVSLQHSGTSNLNETDLAGNDKGPIENGDWVVQVGYGFLLTPGLSLGLGIKGFNSRLDEFKSRGAAVDLGMQSLITPRIGMGISFVELGFQEAYDRVADPLPSQLRLGVRGLVVDTPEVMIQAAAELDRPWTTSDPILLNLGAEYWYERIIAFRAGYRLGADLGNLSLGLGFKWSGASFDYAYVSMGDLGLTHRFTLSGELGTIFEKAKLYVPEIGGDSGPPPPRRIEVSPELR